MKKRAFVFGIPARRGREGGRGSSEGKGERDATAICTSYCPREEWVLSCRRETN